MTPDTNLPDTVDDELAFDVFELSTDASAEEEGRWFVNILGDHLKLDIKIRSFGCKASMSTRRRLEAKFRRHMGADGSYPINVQEKMVCEQLADAIIIDWRGDDWKTKGAPLAYSKENALSVVTHVRQIRNKVAGLASDMDNFRAAERGAIEKN